jgi:hypothetical protein
MPPNKDDPNKIPEAHLEEDKLSPGEETGDQTPQHVTDQRDVAKKRTSQGR